MEQHRQDGRIASLLQAGNLQRRPLICKGKDFPNNILAETLADSITRFVESPRGRMWSWNSSSSPTDCFLPFSSRGLSSTDSSPPASNYELSRSRDRKVLSSLKRLEAKANDFILKTTKQLADIAISLSTRSDFPLDSSLDAVKDLRDHLATISLRSPPVLSYKAKVTEGLGSIEANLKSAKQHWMNMLDSMRVQQTQKHGDAYSNGMSSILPSHLR